MSAKSDLATALRDRLTGLVGQPVTQQLLDDVREIALAFFAKKGLRPQRLCVDVNAEGCVEVDAGDYVRLEEFN
jgi:hypothetical protein